MSNACARRGPAAIQTTQEVRVQSNWGVLAEELRSNVSQGCRADIRSAQADGNRQQDREVTM